MSIQDISIKENLRKGFNHASNQPGWTPSGYKPSRNMEEASYLGDEEYSDRLGVHNPLWRYIIKRYTTESDAPLLVIGYESLPLAIELSQWTYPINLVVKNEYEKGKAKSDALRQAGTFKNILIDGEGYAKSRIAIFIGVIDKMPSERARLYVENLLKGVNEVVCAVKPDRNWKDVFGKKLIDSLLYYKGQWRLLRIN